MITTLSAAGQPSSISALRRPSPCWTVAASFVAAIFVASAVPVGAHAQPTPRDLERAEALATEAKAYFKGKLYKQAATGFMEAYAIARKPPMVFNAARAYEEAREPRRALALFQMYLTLADVSDEGRADAGTRITDLEAVVAAAERASAQADREAAAADRAATKGQEADGAKASPPADPRKDKNGAAVLPPKNDAQGTERKQPLAVAAKPFPLWRSVAAGSLLLFGAAAWVNARRVGAEMTLDDVVDEASLAAYQDMRGEARVWQGVAVGSAVVGLGVGAWAAWDWFLGPPPAAPAAPAWRLLPQTDGRTLGWALSGRF